MRTLCFSLLICAPLFAQDGAAIYKQRCAVCHSAPTERIPSLSAIKAMSGEAIYRVLTNGPMKTQAAELSTGDIFALIAYIGPAASSKAPAAIAPTCPAGTPFSVGVKGPQWNGWSPSLTNSRYQDAASGGINSSNVARLKLKWAFNLGDISEARSQPAVVNGTVFVGSGTGFLFAIDSESGCTRWAFLADAAIRGGVTVGNSKDKTAVFFSDTGSNLYALDAASGKVLWKAHPPDHFASLATATPRYYKGVVYQPYSSLEEALAADPKYNCCTFRGNIAAVDASTGKTIWRTFMIDEAARATIKSPAGSQLFGPSGAGVWSAPTIDEQHGLLYLATGNNYSNPPTASSDAVVALDLQTGKLLWTAQVRAEDAGNNSCGSPVPGNCPVGHGPDVDFGQPPILVSLGGSKRALVIAQKSGVAYGLDPDAEGKLLWKTKLGVGGALGGSQWGSASDGVKLYVAISDLGLTGERDPKSPVGYRLVLDPKKGGGLHAVDVASGKVAWDAAPSTACAADRKNCSAAQSGAVSIASDVVFSGSLDGHLRAYSAATGAVLWDTDTERSFTSVNGPAAHGGSLDAAGAAIVNGMVFVNSGYGQYGGMPGNVLLAFSLE